MVKKIIVVLLMVALLSSFVVAQEYTSFVNIKTLPNSDVFLSIVNPSVDSAVYGILKTRSNMYGDAEFEYTTDDMNEFNFYLRVKVKDGDIQVVPKTGSGMLFDDDVYHIGDSIYLEVLNEGDEPIPTPGIDDVEEEVEVVNDTEEVEVVNDTEEEVIVNDSNSITGRSISELVKMPAVYGGIGGVFIIGILALFIFSRRKKVKVSSSIPSHKDNTHSVSNKAGSHDDDLSKAEARLKAVQAEIQRLKGQDKVSEVKKRIAAEEEELRRLRSGRI